MNAVIVNFAGGKSSRKGNHLILEMETISSKDTASKMIGKKVVWKTPSGKEISGEITKIHGNSGAFKAVMEKGLPGTALGKRIRIEG